MKKTTIIEIIIFLYIVLFLYTGISKLIEYSVFKEQLSESPILKTVAPLAAFMLPWMEFLIALMLVIPRWRLKGLYSALIMMISFTIYVVTLLSFSIQLPCSCGGIIAALSWPQHIIFNSSFILMAVIGIALQRQIRKDIQKAWNPISSNEPKIVAHKL
jgi:hypothetical protein